MERKIVAWMSIDTKQIEANNYLRCETENTQFN